MPEIRARDLPRIALAVLLGVATAMMAPGVVVAQEGQHGIGHAQMHHAYKHWVQPDNGTGCCDNRDCRPTRARMTARETWEAWDGSRWIPIPPAKVLTFKSPDNRSHLCEANGVVFCFVPGPPMF